MTDWERRGCAESEVAAVVVVGADDVTISAAGPVDAGSILVEEEVGGNKSGYLGVSLEVAESNCPQIWLPVFI